MRTGTDSPGEAEGNKQIKKRKTQEKSKREKESGTYNVINHVYFEKDDPFGWPCQFLAFQGVSFAFSILDLQERDMTAVCLAIPSWIHSSCDLWTPAAASDREPKTTVAALTSTCSLRPDHCQPQINYPGESAWERTLRPPLSFLFFSVFVSRLFFFPSVFLTYTSYSVITEINKV